MSLSWVSISLCDDTKWCHSIYTENLKTLILIHLKTKRDMIQKSQRVAQELSLYQY